MEKQRKTKKLLTLTSSEPLRYNNILLSHHTHENTLSSNQIFPIYCITFFGQSGMAAITLFVNV